MLITIMCLVQMLQIFKMKPFTKKELKIIIPVLTFIFILGFFNFRLSLLRSRDHQRKRDVGEIVSALGVYREEFGFYPPSSDGKIVACKRTEITDFSIDKSLNLEENLLRVFKGCEWGEDSLADVSEEESVPYLKTIPSDSDKDKGASYLYISDVSYFQLFAHLENEDDVQYKKEVEKRNLICGMRICNFGKTLDNTPLEISLEDYQKQLMEKGL